MKLLNNILILEEQSKTYLEYDVIIVADREYMGELCTGRGISRLPLQLDC